jgi:AcrR family transcriptional regulator
VRSDASKRQHMLVGATAIFSRYGYARTTMGDIAAEAGISQPALYLLFPDKEALFTAVIRRMDEVARLVVPHLPPDATQRGASPPVSQPNAG